jgi:hypothetical protein
VKLPPSMKSSLAVWEPSNVDWQLFEAQIYAPTLVRQPKKPRI